MHRASWKRLLRSRRADCKRCSQGERARTAGLRSNHLTSTDDDLKNLSPQKKDLNKTIEGKNAGQSSIGGPRPHASSLFRGGIKSSVEKNRRKEKGKRSKGVFRGGGSFNSCGSPSYRNRSLLIDPEELWVWDKNKKDAVIPRAGETFERKNGPMN